MQTWNLSSVSPSWRRRQVVWGWGWYGSGGGAAAGHGTAGRSGPGWVSAAAERSRHPAPALACGQPVLQEDGGDDDRAARDVLGGAGQVVQREHVAQRLEDE